MPTKLAQFQRWPLSPFFSINSPRILPSSTLRPPGAGLDQLLWVAWPAPPKARCPLLSKTITRLALRSGFNRPNMERPSGRPRSPTACSGIARPLSAAVRPPAAKHLGYTRTEVDMTAGIYKISVDRGDGSKKFYVGQASNLYKRRNKYFNRLRRGTGVNRHLQNAFNKYGEKAFSCETILVCEKNTEVLTMFEGLVLSLFNEDELYNIRRTSCDSSLGVIHTEEARLKMSKAHQGRKFSADHRAKIAAANKGQNKGHKYPPGHPYYPPRS